MSVITIPKTLSKKGDLIVIPRKEYEVMLRVIKEKDDDWIYAEPFLSELKKRIRIAKKAVKSNQIINWKKS